MKPFKKEYETKIDTVNATYKSISIQLVFLNYYDTEKGKQVITLFKIYTDDNRIITKSGIKTGDNKFDIVRKLDGSFLNLSSHTEKGKPYSTLVLQDATAGTMMTFYFKDNLLYAIALEYQDEGC